MSYRSLRKFKQAQRDEYAEWEAKRDRELDAHLDDSPPLTEAERAAEWDLDYWSKVDEYPRTNRQLGWGL